MQNNLVSNDSLSAIATALREAREELANDLDAWEARTPAYSSVERLQRDRQLKSDTCFNDLISGDLAAYHGNQTKDATELLEGFETVIRALTDSLRSKEEVLQVFLTWADEYANTFGGVGNE